MSDHPRVHREIEHKLRVSEDFVIPDLVASGSVSAVSPGTAFSMAAAYHDTIDLRLFRWRATLRRREGGGDEGWHLKLPVTGAAPSTRDEIHMPLSAGRPGFVPAELADIVSPMARGERLQPVVIVRTFRTPTVLLARDGVPCAELVDDRVTVLDPNGQLVGSFRDLEVEALDSHDDEALRILDRVVETLVAAGARVSSVSKAAAALGSLAAAPADIVVPPMPGRKALATEVLRTAVATHARHLMLSDVAVRRDLPDSVHQLRVAARRLRSVLQNFESLLDPEWARMLEDELAWLANEMGAVRDTEVLIARLDAHAQGLGSTDALLARSVIDSSLNLRLSGARSGALAALRSERHDLLLDDLVQAAREPRFSLAAHMPSEIVLPRLVGRTWRRLVKSVSGLKVDGDSQEWHRARIRAKRARYAVETVAPLFGADARRFAHRLEVITEILGDHQDASVAQRILRDLTAASAAPEGTIFALGRLHEIERAKEQEYRIAFLESWPAVIRAAKHSGLT